MGVFHFKRFDVLNERSAMKVNTDGVLLGAVTEVFAHDRNVLDIGTGTGTVALMIAQRLSELNDDFIVHAIDIDEPSSQEAAENFLASPWPQHFKSFNAGLKSFSEDSGIYDLVVSNPPYYDNSLKAPSARRNSARHVGDPEDGSGSEILSYREILEYSMTHLGPGGRISLVLPADQENALLRHARMCGFLPWKLLRVKTVPRKDPSRIIVRFMRRGDFDGMPEEDTLTLMNEEGKRASQQTSLLADYLL